MAETNATFPPDRSSSPLPGPAALGEPGARDGREARDPAESGESAESGGPVRVLLLEDNDADADLVREGLAGAGIDAAVDRVMTREQFTAALASARYDLILADQSLPAFDGMSALALVRASDPDVPFIFVSGQLGEDAAVETLKRGATDYVLKARLQRLGPVVLRALQESAAREQRRRAEAALRESEERFRVTFEQAAVGMAHIGLDGRWLRVNQRLCEIVGYRHDEIMALTFQDVTHPEDLEADLAQVRRLLAGETESYTMEKRYLRRDGSVAWVNLTASLVRGPEGRPKYFISVIEDVSQRRTAEERRRMSEFRFQRLIEHSPLSTQVFAPDGSIRQVNRAWEELWGVTAADLPGYNILRDGQLAERGVLPLIRRAFEGEAVTVEPIAYVPDRGRQAGVVKWCGAYVYPVKDASGRVEEVILVHNDVTARKNAEEAAREAERAYRAIFEATRDGLIINAPDGTIVEANPAACRMHGYDYEQFLGLHSQQFVHPDDHPLFEKFVEVAGAGGEFRTEARDVRRDGSVFPVEVLGTSFTYRGGKHLLGVVRDVSERQAAEHARAHLAAIVESSDDAVISKDLDGTVRTWNGGAEKLFGYAAGEVIGRSVMLLIPPERRGEEEAILRSLRQGRPVEHYETERVRKDGTRVEVSVAVSPVRGPDGKVVGASKIARDISQRKRAEAELRAAKDAAESRLAQWRAAVASMSEGLIVSDPAGNLLDWNRAALEMHGFAAASEAPGRLDEFPARFELRTADGATVPVGEWPLSRALRGETFAGCEFHVRRLDRGAGPDAHLKGERVISYSGTPVRDRQGAFFLAILTLHDMTEERRAQRALRQAAEHLALAIAAADLGDWSWDADTDAITLSPRAAEIFGVPPGSHSTRTRMRDLLHEEDRERARLASERAAAGRGDYDVEYRVNRPDGTQVWVAAKGRARHDESGRLRGMLGVLQDVTARKRAEEALRDSEERLRLGLDAGKTGTWDWDIVRDKVTWSDRVYEFHGLRPGEFDGSVESFSRIVHPDDRERVRAAIRTSLRDHTPYEVEFRVVWPNGEVHWISTNGKVYYAPDGTPLRMLGATTDVTARKAAEAEREQLLAGERSARAEAERQSRMKDEFLATLSHELRTPLNAILGWSQLLRTARLSGADAAEGLESIERNARVQTALIEDLLDMSRIISGKIRLDVRRAPLTPVIEAAVETVRPAAAAKGIRLGVELDPLAGSVAGDPNRLQQVVWNLVSNAIKYTPAGGQVRVLLERVNSHLEVSVSDTGEGIDPDFLPHVFDRFRQADGSTTRKHGGLGLGLAIVRHLVELHGGTVRAKSPGRGQGSTFIVSLPVTTPQSESGDPARPQSRADEQGDRAVSAPPLEVSLAGLKVLVVDDEPDARLLFQRVLEESGAEVLTAGSAAEAMDALRGGFADLPDPAAPPVARATGATGAAPGAAPPAAVPALLISDVGMPGEDGYALIRQVRALPRERGGALPAIALTAYARSEDRTRALIAGFQLHLYKPVEPGELIATVASLAGRTGPTYLR